MGRASRKKAADTVEGRDYIERFLDYQREQGWSEAAIESMFMGGRGVGKRQASRIFRVSPALSERIYAGEKITPSEKTDLLLGARVEGVSQTDMLGDKVFLSIFKEEWKIWGDDSLSEEEVSGAYGSLILESPGQAPSLLEAASKIDPHILRKEARGIVLEGEDWIERIGKPALEHLLLRNSPEEREWNDARDELIRALWSKRKEKGWKYDIEGHFLALASLLRRGGEGEQIFLSQRGEGGLLPLGEARREALLASLSGEANPAASFAKSLYSIILQKPVLDSALAAEEITERFLGPGRRTSDGAEKQNPWIGFRPLFLAEGERSLWIEFSSLHQSNRVWPTRDKDRTAERLEEAIEEISESFIEEEGKKISPIIFSSIRNKILR